MSDSVRAYLRDELGLPSSWTVIPAQRFPETIARTTVVLQHARIERLAEAPVGNLRHEVVLSVVSPKTDIAAAEDDLDDAVTTLLSAIDGHASIGWTQAEKVMHQNTYPAWNVTLTVITNRTEEV